MAFRAGGKNIRAAIGALVMLVALAPAAIAEKYASIVVDADSNEVLHARHADEPRYPASLTKAMTLYMLFDALKSGEVSYTERLYVSRHAASQPPSSLRLTPGSTISVRDAIDALITKSANDVAAVVAERLGGTESRFATLMTAKAKTFGMNNTTFRNASGLPDTRQLSTARDMAEAFSSPSSAAVQEPQSVEDLWDAPEQKTLSLVVKADTQGSLDALIHGIEKIHDTDIRILHQGVGGITENDVLLAKVSQAFVVAFHVRAPSTVRTLIEKSQVSVSYHTIIYALLDEVRSWHQGLKGPVESETILGHAEVRQLFNIPKIGMVAGCMVQKGTIVRGQLARLLRDQAVVYEGTIQELRKHKDALKEAKTGHECGIFLGYQDVKENDIIECYEIEEQPQT